MEFEIVAKLIDTVLEGKETKVSLPLVMSWSSYKQKNLMNLSKRLMAGSMIFGLHLKRMIKNILLLALGFMVDIHFL